MSETSWWVKPFSSMLLTVRALAVSLIGFGFGFGSAFFGAPPFIPFSRDCACISHDEPPHFWRIRALDSLADSIILILRLSCQSTTLTNALLQHLNKVGNFFYLLFETRPVALLCFCLHAFCAVFQRFYYLLYFRHCSDAPSSLVCVITPSSVLTSVSAFPSKSLRYLNS